MGYYETILRGKFIAVNGHIKRIKQTQINNVMIYLKGLRKIKKNPKSDLVKGK